MIGFRLSSRSSNCVSQSLTICLFKNCCSGVGCGASGEGVEVGMLTVASGSSEGGKNTNQRMY